MAPVPVRVLRMAAARRSAAAPPRGLRTAATAAAGAGSSGAGASRRPGAGAPPQQEERQDHDVGGASSSSAGATSWGPFSGGTALLEAAEGPILADFLAMGAGHAALPSAGSHSEAQPPAVQAVTLRPPAKQAPMLPEKESPRPEAAPRERRLVVAALRPSKAVGQAPTETPQRTPLSSRSFRRREQVPSLFEESYISYVESCTVNDFDESSEPLPLAPDARENTVRGKLRRMTLQVRPWHRDQLQKMLCRALLFQFLQDQRKSLGLNSQQRPLCSWEAKAALEHSGAGQIEALVKYLAETEFHIQLGPVRSAHFPGLIPPRDIEMRMRAERHRLRPSWGLSGRHLQEDAVVRAFLDGQLSWPGVREMLLGQKTIESTAVT
mmetsp:Transcript_14204/g.28112  ORF Transcript_14204/g.28112 Transcript_14204/m.28112 type:complete len:381 (-) Transcript_14204:83-1225(-)